MSRPTGQQRPPVEQRRPAHRDRLREPGRAARVAAPNKTGTTAIQSAVFAAKDKLPEHRVEFPATTRHPTQPALAACARPALMVDTVPTEKHWTRLRAAYRRRRRILRPRRHDHLRAQSDPAGMDESPLGRTPEPPTTTAPLIPATSKCRAPRAVRPLPQTTPAVVQRQNAGDPPGRQRDPRCGERL